METKRAISINVRRRWFCEKINKSNKSIAKITK
jgi:hypothetical protein